MSDRLNDFLSYAKSLMATGKGLIHVYNTGTLTDYSGNGAVVSSSSGAAWQHGKKGHTLQCQGGGLTITDQASLRTSATGLSIVSFGDFSYIPTLGTGDLAAKRDAGTIDYHFYYASTPSLVLRIGANAPFVLTNPVGKTCLGVSLTSGSTARFFGDGRYIATSAASATVQDNQKQLNIGEALGSSYTLKNALSATLIYPDVILTDKQHAILYELFQRVRVNTSTSKLSPFRSRQLSSEVLRLDGPKSNTCLDLSGNGNNGVVTGKVMTTDGITGSAAEFFGEDAGLITVADSATIQDVFTRSLSVWIRPTTEGESGFGYVIQKGIIWQLLTDGDATFADIVYEQDYTGNNGEWTYQLPAGGREYYIGISHNVSDTSSDPIFVINGVEVTPTETSTPSGDPVSDAAGDLYVGNQGAGNSTFDGLIDDVRIYNTCLSASELKDIYLETALRNRRLAHTTEYPTSLSSVTSEFVGPWEIGSGTWQWQDDGTKRKLVCVAAGHAWSPSSQVFGGWYYKLKKADGSISGISLLLDKPEALSSENGYRVTISSTELLRFYRIDAGVAVSLFNTTIGYVSPDTEYEFYLTRRVIDSLFSLYIRGGTYADWTLVGSVVDATYTTSNFILTDVDSDDEVSDVIFFPFGDTIDPTAGDLDKQIPNI